MICPLCKSNKIGLTNVVYSSHSPEGYFYCVNCGHRSPRYEDFISEITPKKIDNVPEKLFHTTDIEDKDNYIFLDLD